MKQVLNAPADSPSQNARSKLSAQLPTPTPAKIGATSTSVLINNLVEGQTFVVQKVEDVVEHVKE